MAGPGSRIDRGAGPRSASSSRVLRPTRRCVRSSRIQTLPVLRAGPPSPPAPRREPGDPSAPRHLHAVVTLCRRRADQAFRYVVGDCLRVAFARIVEAASPGELEREPGSGRKALGELDVRLGAERGPDPALGAGLAP